MESCRDQMTLSFNEATDLLDEAGAFFRGGNVDANPMHWLIKMSCNTSCPNTIDSRAAYSQFNVANRDSQAFGAVTRTPVYPPPTFSAFPTASFGGIPLSITGSYLDSGGLSYGNGNMGFHGAMSHIIKPSHAQSSKFAVQPLESCQRKFVMFDCEGSKGRMIFHPALLKDKPALVPPKSETAVAYNQDSLVVKDSSGNDKYTKSSSPSLIAPLGAPFSIHNADTQPTKANLTFISHTPDNLVTPFSALRDITEAKMDMKQLDCSAERYHFSHEDTEDIEALLSSDEDEVSSTGHSPSDITRQISPIESPSSHQRNSKRRKRGWEDHVDDDVCSTGTSGKNMCKAMSSQKVEGAGSEAAHSKEGVAFQLAGRVNCLGYTEGDLAARNVVISDELSSSSSANDKKCLNNSISVQHRQQLGGQCKKERIRSILHLLREVLPGGESMDTAFVLDETIQYVKTLQFEVQKLQAGKLLKP